MGFELAQQRYLASQKPVSYQGAPIQSMLYALSSLLPIIAQGVATYEKEKGKVDTVGKLIRSKDKTQ